MGKKNRKARRGGDSDASDDEVPHGKAASAAAHVDDEAKEDSPDLAISQAKNQLNEFLPVWVQHAHDVNSKTKVRTSVCLNI